MQLKTSGRAALAAAVCLSLGAGAAHADFPGVVDFEDFTLATNYNVNDMETSGGVTITFDTFYWLPGDTPFNGGFAEIHNDQDSGGTGLDMETNNINAHFDFGGDVSMIKVLFGEFGGNLNIQINGTLVNVNTWLDIDNTTIAGVDASIATFDGSHGQIILVGTISSFAIGGQELWIDDVEYKLVPAPGALALLVPAAIFGSRRRRR